MYLPNNATIDVACDWLEHQTGQNWTLARLLEVGHLVPYFWKDYEEGLPQIFGDRREGYLCKMFSRLDVMRLAADGDDARCNWVTAHDGTPIQIRPPISVELKHLRFMRQDVERVAEKINGSKPVTAPTPAPVESTTQRQDRRLQACIDAGLSMDSKDALLRLPYGIGLVAVKEGVTRQTFTMDVKAALKRRDAANRACATVHRA